MNVDIPFRAQTSSIVVTLFFLSFVALLSSVCGQCSPNNDLADALCFFNNGSLWNANNSNEQYQEFVVQANQCSNNMPIYYLYLDPSSDDGADYSLLYEDGIWKMSSFEVSIFEVARCKESDLLQCVKGKWQILIEDDDDLITMIVDETMHFVNGQCDQTETADDNDSAPGDYSRYMELGISIAITIVLFIFIYFCVKWTDCKSKKRNRSDNETDIERPDPKHVFEVMNEIVNNVNG